MTIQMVGSLITLYVDYTVRTGHGCAIGSRKRGRARRRHVGHYRTKQREIN